MSNAAEEKKANLIFDKWKAELKELDRSKANVEANFDTLFLRLKESKISFDAAHSILPKAIIAHYPNQSVIDNVYRRVRISGKPKQEFADEWKENIDAAAKRIFYSLYDIDGVAKEDPEEEKKEYGSMSASEYRKQRKHFDSIPELDWTKIKLEPMSIEDLIEMENMSSNLEDSDE